MEEIPLVPFYMDSSQHGKCTDENLPLLKKNKDFIDILCKLKAGETNDLSNPSLFTPINLSFLSHLSYLNIFNWTWKGLSPRSSTSASLMFCL